jgi:methylthioribose-1-phosphate isomerase
VIRDLRTVEDAEKAIRTMIVRGAPLIGAAAAYGMALAMAPDPSDANLERALHRLLALATDRRQPALGARRPARCWRRCRRASAVRRPTAAPPRSATRTPRSAGASASTGSPRSSAHAARRAASTR